MDRIDVEILCVLHSVNGEFRKAEGIKMMGPNLPEPKQIENRLNFLKDQNYVERGENLSFRLTSYGKNLFWKDYDLENNILRLLNVENYES